MGRIHLVVIVWLVVIPTAMASYRAARDIRRDWAMAYVLTDWMQRIPPWAWTLTPLELNRFISDQEFADSVQRAWQGLERLPDSIKQRLGFVDREARPSLPFEWYLLVSLTWIAIIGASVLTGIWFMQRRRKQRAARVTT